MELLMVGLNYRSAPLEVREAFAFGEDEAKRRRGALAGSPGVREAAVLATCNRTEVYAVASDVEVAEDALARFFCRVAGDANTPMRHAAWLYRKRGREVVDHLLRVAAGLDSMVVGEAQILGQVRCTLQQIVEADRGGPVLPRLFRAGVETGKRSRTETGIGLGARSVSHAAVELARSIFGDLRERRICLVGAGTMGELAARNLRAHGASTVIVNRSAEAAQKLAEELRSEAGDLEDLITHLERADVVVASTGASRPVITKETVESVMAKRRGRALYMIDIAVPRDVEPGVEWLDGVFSYNIDDLYEIVRKNGEERAREIPAVERIVAEEAARFVQWLQERRAAPAIRGMRERAERLRRDEVARTLRKHPGLGATGKAALEAATVALVNKLLHTPTVYLKEWARAGMEDDERLRVASELIGVECAAGRDEAAGGGSDRHSAPAASAGEDGAGQGDPERARGPEHGYAREEVGSAPVSLPVRGESFGHRGGPDPSWDAPERIGAASDGTGGGDARAGASGDRF